MLQFEARFSDILLFTKNTFYEIDKVGRFAREVRSNGERFAIGKGMNCGFDNHGFAA